MPAPSYAASDFLNMLLQLLPKGEAWSTDVDTDINQSLATLTPTYERNAASGVGLLVDAFPASTDYLVTEWQASLGLPDPCLGDAPTLQQEQQQIVARFASTGGQSVPFFIKYAATLGYSPVTIQEFSPFLSSRSKCNSKVDHADELAYIWQVTCPAATTEYFKCNENKSGDPLGVIIGAAVIECEFNSLKPAHTIAEYVFG